MDKIQIIENLFYYTFLYSFLIPLVAIFFIRKFRRDTICILVLLYGLVYFLLNLFFPYFDNHNFLKIYYFVYTFLEYGLFAYILYSKIQDRRFRILMLILSIAFIAFQILHYYTSKLKIIDSIPIGIETILIFIYIFFFFYEQFKYPSSAYLSQNYIFWIIIGILFYLGSSFFFYILADYVSEQIIQYWDLTYIGDIVKNILFLCGLYMYKPSNNGNYSNRKKSPKLPFLDMDFTQTKLY